MIPRFNIFPKFLLYHDKKYKGFITRLVNLMLHIVFFESGFNDLNFSSDDIRVDCDFKGVFYENICKVYYLIKLLDFGTCEYSRARG